MNCYKCYLHVEDGRPGLHLHMYPKIIRVNGPTKNNNNNNRSVLKFYFYQLVNTYLTLASYCFHLVRESLLIIPRGSFD